MKRALRNEDGQIALLSMAYVAIVLVLVLVLAAISSIYLEHKELLALADQVAADAADSVDLEAYYGTDQGGGAGSQDVSSTGGASQDATSADTGSPGDASLPITNESVRDAVKKYLEAAPTEVTSEFENLKVGAPTGTTDGHTAVVTLQSKARPPVIPWVLVPWSDGFTIEVTARARAH